MAANDWMRTALDHYRVQRDRILATLPPEMLGELRNIELMIRNLERDLGEGGSRQAENIAPPATNQAASGVVGLSGGRSPEIRPDEFFAMTISDAARAYLTKVGHAVTIDNLIEALRAGGCKLSGANPKKVLYISLVRNTRDFVPVGSGFLGLRSFYPGLKAASSAPMKAVKHKKSNKAKVKTRAKKVLVKKKANGEKAVPQSGETLAHKIVYQALSDGELHPKDAILKAGKDAGVMPIAIHGILRNAKDIETVGDSYRLKKEPSRTEDVKAG